MRYLIAFLCLFNILGALAQSDSTAEVIEVDFLFHYYEQDGVHSAVTGGQGTEELTDRAGKIVVSVPLDSIQSLRVQTDVNHYTSASTDKIDAYVSSASRQDSRASLQFAYQRQLGDQYQAGMGAGMSVESDYLSKSLAANWSWLSKDENQSLSLQGQAFFDTWIVIFPEELRAPGLVSVPTDKRRSFNLAATWGQVLGPKVQASLGAELVVQQGLLSTPFHRVYFQNQSLPRIEKFPLWRLKYPIGMRLNWFATDWLVLRSYYRYYFDSFDIKAHTFRLEVPLKLHLSLTLLPYYRFHTQTAASFFAPYNEHLDGATYWTSDFDLSAFQSHRLGLGVRFSPLYGLLRFRLGKKRIAMFKSLGLRYAYYQRSDGLKANILSLDMSWKL
ncbi:MAG: DUF3570 domain-containing protein [Bacteroidia bacterium]